MRGNIVEKQCLLLAVAHIFNYFEGFLIIGRVGGKVELVVITTILFRCCALRNAVNTSIH